MENKKRKFKFCPRKNKNKKLNKNTSSDLIEPNYHILNHLNLNIFNYPVELPINNLTGNNLNKFGFDFNKINNDKKILNINANIINTPHNILKNNFININKYNNNKKIPNLKNAIYKKNYSKDNIFDNQESSNLSFSKSTKNNSAYTSLSIGKYDINYNSNKKNKSCINNNIKTKYNNYKNFTKIDSFKNNDNQSISKIDFSSITDKDISNISNINLSGKNNQKRLKKEDLMEISKKKKNIIF